jgi:hypothetical protein
MVGQDVKFSQEVYWYLVTLKFNGKFRSIDAVLRHEFGLKPGKNPHLKNYSEEGVLVERSSR